MAQGTSRGPCLGPNVKFFSETVFILCNNIDKNLNKNFHSWLSYHSFKPLLLFFQICTISILKKFEKEKWPKARYLSLYTQILFIPIQTHINICPPCVSNYLCYETSKNSKGIEKIVLVALYISVNFNSYSSNRSDKIAVSKWIFHISHVLI